MNRVSKLFLPLIYKPQSGEYKKDLSSKAHRLMQELGLIKSTSFGGYFYLMPMLQKSLEKCTSLIDHYMESVDGQKMTIPTLTATSLLKKSGRLDAFGNELFTLKDREQKSYALSPTFEESITNLIATTGSLSYQQYPVRLYQISSKFRDELSPGMGLMRAREFVMKDLYTFDVDRAASLRTYEEVNEAYWKLLSTIGVPFLKVEADTGDMGGSLSHEYHFQTPVGENSLLKCVKCGFASNVEKTGDVQTCPKCNSDGLEQFKGLEIAHTFQLDDKYTKPLQANYLQVGGKPVPLQMACFGIGVTRLIAAALECLSSQDTIRWPFHLAPYSVCIVQPKDGSKEQPQVQHFVDIVYGQLTQIPYLKKSVIVDDRNQFTIGQRVLQAKRLGYPMIVVVGRKATDHTNPLFEVIFAHNGAHLELPLPELIQHINQFVEENTKLL